MKIWNSILAFLGGEELIAAAFKRTDLGWIFVAPGLSGRRTYLIDDQLKDKITATYVRTWRYAVLLPIVIALIAGIPVINYFPILQSGYDLIIYAAFGGVWALVAMAFYTARVRIMVKDAPKTDGTISATEQQRNIVDATPTWRVVVYLLISLGFTALAVLPATSAGMPLAHRIVLVVMFGLATVYYLATLVVKLIRTPSTR